MFVRMFLSAFYIKSDAVYITFQASILQDKMWYFIVDCTDKNIFVCFHFITFSTMNEKQDIKGVPILFYEKIGDVFEY